MAISRIRILPLCLALILLAMTACHRDHDLHTGVVNLPRVETAASLEASTTPIPVETVDLAYLSRFPRRDSITDPMPTGLGQEMPPEAMAMQTVFTLPLMMEATCFGAGCASGIALSGSGVMVVDLDQRRVTVESLDLTDATMAYHLSGLVMYDFDDFTMLVSADAEAMLSVATPDQIIDTDRPASMIITSHDLEAGMAAFDLQASGGDHFIVGRGFTTGDELE
ncbi:MAG: hypothetical protein ACON4P_02205 [Candidatus Puniceispirillales bacterium]